MVTGSRGELVFTSLTKEALPIVRYRTRDLTRLLPGTARSMRRREKITGRSDDMEEPGQCRVGLSPCPQRRQTVAPRVRSTVAMPRA